MTFSRFRSLFLSDLYCSYSEVKLIANINWLQHIKKEGSDGPVGSALLGIGKFSTRLSLESNSSETCRFMFFYSRKALAEAILRHGFLQLKEFELYWGALFTTQRSIDGASF